MGDLAKKSLGDAEETIKRFGGIRPMSNKTGIAVTTIQGWKKRGVIPETRYEDILTAAKLHGIDLQDTQQSSGEDDSAEENSASNYESADFNENEDAQESENEDVSKDLDAEEGKDTDTEETDEVLSLEDIKVADDQIEGSATKHEQNQEDIHDSHFSFDDEEDDEAEEEKAAAEIPVLMRPRRSDEFMHKRKQPESADFTQIVIEEKSSKAGGYNKAVGFGLLLLVLAAGAVLIVPKLGQKDDAPKDTVTIADAEQEPQQPTSFKGLVPEDWSEQLEQLKHEAAQAKQAIDPALQEIQSAGQEFMDGNTAAIQSRVQQLESYVTEITESTSISGLYARISEMGNTVLGQDSLNQAMQGIYNVYGGLNPQEKADPEAINSKLDEARERDFAMGETFANVPKKDLQAAAMLLAMTQMRSSLAREHVPFEEDLAVLMGMVGKDDVELQASLDRLAPHAKSGVLTPQGLSNEFRGLAGDVVVSSLKGEEISLAERAQARMNDFLAIEKDGELITGTKTQAVVNKAQKKLDEGKVSDALSLLKENLSAPELEPLRPWMSKAEGLAAAIDVRRLINQNIELNLGTGFLGGSQLLNEDAGTR